MGERLSKDHRILEKGGMERRPFGTDEQGEKIRDVSGVVVCRLLNERIADPSYHVTPEFLKNPWHSYAYEFVAYLGEFCERLSGDPQFQSRMAREKFFPTIIRILGRPFSLAQIY